MNVMEIVDKASDIVVLASLVISAASALAALTPTPKDDAKLMKARKVLETLALNVRHAKGGIRDK